MIDIPYIGRVFFKDAWVMGLIVPLFIILIILIKRRFVDIDKKKYKRTIAKFGRTLLLFSRVIAIALLLIAMAYPFTIQEERVEGDPKIALLVDNSTSMELFDIGFVNSMEEKLKEEIPTTTRLIGEGNNSAISEGLYSNMDMRNIIMVTDGRNYKGKDLTGTLLLGMSQNISLYVVSIESKRSDAGITIEGPSKVVEGVENDYTIKLSKANKEDVSVKISIDGEVVEKSTTAEDMISIRKGFTEGRHVITAEIEENDYFLDNNIFYKTIKVIEKPKMLLIAEGSSPISTLLDKMYELEKRTSLPESLEEYLAIIIDNMHADSLSDNDVDRLSEYVNLGDGLVMVGGENSFDYGDYKGSFIEALLPVRIAKGKEKPSKDVNVILLIDISGSTSHREKLEKDIALTILDQMEPDNYVSAIGYFTKIEILSGFVKNSESASLRKSIDDLRNRGGTNMHDAVVEALDMLEGREGSRNIIVISDGMDNNIQTYIGLIEQASEEGIVTHSVDIGEKTNVVNMKMIAEMGNGNYFKPEEAKAVEIVFDKKEDQFPLMMLPKNHFISSDLKLNSYVTGFNQVVPKSSGVVLATTAFGDPIVVAGRYGLGRIAVLATDDGKFWGSDILRKDPKMISRVMNWAIENPERKKESYIEVSDTYIDDTTKVYVKASNPPEEEGLIFSKIDENLYMAEIEETGTGIKTVLGQEYAVNYHRELQEVGMNKEFLGEVNSIGQNIVNRDDIGEIVSGARQASIETVQKETSLRTYLLLAGFTLLLLEMVVRRFFRYRKLYK